ncbi:hypothetical protein GCM10010431_72780 [Streptomyces kunmingensis]
MPGSSPVVCHWRYLPHDFPSYTAVYYYFGLWRDDGDDDNATLQDSGRAAAGVEVRRPQRPSLRDRGQGML